MAADRRSEQAAATTEPRCPGCDRPLSECQADDVDERSTRDTRATFELTDSGSVAMLYVYTPGRAKIGKGESKRQLTQPCQAIFDYDEGGELLGVEVIVKVPDA